MDDMKNTEGSKSRIHRTSSTRKARRKNEFTGDGTDFKHHSSVPVNIHPTKFEWSRKNLKFLIGFHLRRLATIIIAAGCAVWYFCYAGALFENSTRFSHLTNVERELSLPTDVAFRYSFFKKIALAEGYIDGLRLVTRDFKNEQVPPTASSFHRHSLSPEAVLAGVFHGLKVFKGWTGWPKTQCIRVIPEGFLSSGTIFTHHQGDNVTDEKDKVLKDEEFFTLSCSGLDDPLHFYLVAARTLESAMMILIFFMGLSFGKSILGGTFAVAMFVFLHPQRSNYEWLFPLQEKIGWVLVVIQIFTIFRTLFCKIHPPWSSAVKIAIATAVLILGWNTEAQWFLASQLIIIVTIHFCGGFSRYVASIVILGQLTGWQYASLVSLDPTLHHWSFFMYTLLACVVTVILIEPILDWILGRKRDKWKFFRGSILVIIFQTILVSVRCDLGQLFTFLEDSRFPLTIGDPYEGTKPWMNMLEERDLAEQLHLPDLDPNIFQSSDLNWRKESVNAEINKNSIESQNLRHRVNTKSGNEDSSVADSAWALSLQLTEFLRTCFLCHAKSSLVTFFSKHFFLIFAAMYAVIAVVILPLCVPSASSLLFLGESDDEEPYPCSSSEDDDDKFQHLFSNNKEQGHGRRMKSDNVWLWQSYLSYHIAQTVFFALFCLWLDKRWEMFFVPHVCVLLSLLCDFRRLSKLLRIKPFSYALHVHWGTVFVIVAILVAGARLRSNAAQQSTRGRFEIGNARVGGLMEVVKWIQENADSSAVFAGADNIMVALDLSVGRSSVSHHLTVHCWANENGCKPQDKDRGEHDKLKKRTESPTRTNTRQAQVANRNRATAEIEPHETDLQDGEDEGEFEEEKSSRELNSKLVEKDMGEGQAEMESHITVAMTSRLTSQEMVELAQVYSVFSRNKSIVDFHSGLVTLNVSYFIISQQMCPEQSSSHSSTTSSSSALNTLSSTTFARSSGSNSQEGDNLVRGTHALPSKLDSAQIFFRSGERGEVEQRNFSISGIWQWHWNWQEPIENHENQLLSLQFPKRCDLTRFWDDVERKRDDTSTAGRDQNQYSYAKGQGNPGKDADFTFQSRIPRFNKRDRSADPNVRVEDKHSHDETSEDTLCYRLLKERNILPFTRIFQNDVFTILLV